MERYDPNLPRSVNASRLVEEHQPSEAQRFVSSRLKPKSVRVAGMRQMKFTVGVSDWAIPSPFHSGGTLPGSLPGFVFFVDGKMNVATRSFDAQNDFFRFPD